MNINFLCNFCKKTGIDVITCSKCEITTYCSEQCQTLDFLNHSQKCEISIDKKKESNLIFELLKSNCKFRNIIFGLHHHFDLLTIQNQTTTLPENLGCLTVQIAKSINIININLIDDTSNSCLDKNVYICYVYHSPELSVSDKFTKQPGYGRILINHKIDPLNPEYILQTYLSPKISDCKKSYEAFKNVFKNGGILTKHLIKMKITETDLVEFGKI